MHTYIQTHTMEYYSAVKKSEILPFAAESHIQWNKLDKYYIVPFMGLYIIVPPMGNNIFLKRK